MLMQNLIIYIEDLHIPRVQAMHAEHPISFFLITRTMAWSYVPDQ